MIIDMHTHIFPDRLASRALDGLSHSGHVRYYTDGTLSGLRGSMQENGIDRSVVLQVVTRAGQESSVNRAAAELQEKSEKTGIYAFGGIHPDASDPKGVIREMVHMGLPGVKLHPAFCKVPLDDIRYLRIIDYACEADLLITTHAGYDISFPGEDYCSPKRIRRVLDQLHPPRMILAHLGGWECWQEVEELLAGQPVWFDTSFVLTKLREPVHFQDPMVIPADRSAKEGDLKAYEDYHKPASELKGFIRPRNQLSAEDFVRIVRKHGAERVLFGSDSPWSSQGESVEVLKQTGLTSEELSMILGGNASKLLE